MSGSLAMQSSTWAWFVRNVQWVVVPSLDIDDRVILYSVSRFLFLVLFVTRSVSEISKPAGSSHRREREMGSVDPLRITVDEERRVADLRCGSTVRPCLPR